MKRGKARSKNKKEQEEQSTTNLLESYTNLLCSEPSTLLEWAAFLEVLLRDPKVYTTKHLVLAKGEAQNTSFFFFSLVILSLLLLLLLLLPSFLLFPSLFI
jgi:uncharacterized membrane protein